MAHEFDVNADDLKFITNVSDVERALIQPQRPDQSDIPEEFRQRVYGDHPTETLRLSELVYQLGQTREQDNPITASLRRSIGRIGLLNNIQVGRLNEVEFRAYVDFSNRIWGKNRNADDLPVADDGGRRLVIAGHTRTKSLIAHAIDQAERAREAGYDIDPAQAQTLVKSYESPSPQLIVALQTDENIHREVPKERQAMGTVETYYYGLENGLWVSEATFIEEMDGKYSPELLSDAMHFASLPEFVREQVFIGAVPYSVAIEASKTYRSHIRYTLFKDYSGRSVSELDPDELAELDKTTFNWLNAEFVELHRKNLLKKGRIGVVNKRLKSYRDNWQEEIDRYVQSVQNGTDVDQLDLFGQEWVERPNTDFKERSDLQAKEIKRQLGGLAIQPLEQLRSVVMLHYEAARAHNGAYADSFDPEEVLERIISAIGDTPVASDIQLAIADIERYIKPSVS